MHKLLNWLVANAPLHHKIGVRIAQIRYMRYKRVLRTLLLPPALQREV
ncbi:hypothetical protein ABXJ76_07970 [Methylobacter sp. G7]